MPVRHLIAILLTLAATRTTVADLPDCGNARARLVAASNAFDPVDGSDPNRYPPQFPVDFRHLRLELNFEKLTDRSFEGVATFTLRAIRPDLRRLKLNAVDLYIDAVTDGHGGPVPYDHDAADLVLHFDRPLPTDSDSVFVIRYRCVDPEEGMYFALPDAAYPDRPLVVHTQGETETSRYWFPCLDAPYDRLTTEMIATVPEPYFALSNGRLVDTRHDDRTKHVTYHWRQRVPHVFYLVTLVIGRFDKVEYRWRDIPVDVYVAPGRADDARRTYQRTPQMIEFFSNRLGVDYPYEKYAQVIVPRFRFGGMENTSATTMHDQALLDERAALDRDLDSLIAHELAHQWFGDLITCRNWPHVWLNEGFATFMNTLWSEEHLGREQYLSEMFDRIQEVADADTTDTPGRLVLSRYDDSFEPFFHKGALAYSKGSCLLHMLRHQLGDDLFFRALQTYTRTHRETQVETDSLRRVFEEVTGRSLEQFFDQWAYRPGTPHLEVRYAWHDKQHVAEVTIRQTQKIDADTPAFDVPLDLLFRAGGETVTTTVRLAARTDAYRRRFDVKPDLFCVDPNAGLLARIKTDKPRAMWLTQLAQGPTNVTRIVAARALAEHRRAEVVTALATALNDQTLHRSVRAAAATALGTLHDDRAMDALVAALHRPLPTDDRLRDALQVRAVAARALGNYDDPRAVVMLLGLATADVSYAVEAAATEALGRINPIEDAALSTRVVETLVANAHKTSHENGIRFAALRALADRRATQAIPVARQYAEYGQHDRLRPVAVGVLARLTRVLGPAAAEYFAARDFLISLLNDSQERTVIAAIEALGTLADAESRAAIERRLAGHTTAGVRRTGRSVLERLRASPAVSPTIQPLRDDLDAFRRRLDKLDDRLKHVENAAPGDNP